MLQAGIETRLTFRQMDILRWSYFILNVNEGILRASFYIYVINYPECSVLEKIFCILAYVLIGKFPN